MTWAPFARANVSFTLTADRDLLTIAKTKELTGLASLLG